MKTLLKLYSGSLFRLFQIAAYGSKEAVWDPEAVRHEQEISNAGR
jgi:hypothetical protein